MKKLHRALRPQGILLDIHPEPMPAAVEIATPAGRMPLRPLTDASDLIANVHAARTLVGQLVDQCYFAVEEVMTFAFVSCFDTIDALFALRQQRGSSTPVDEAAVAEARTLMRQTGGELRIIEQISARRLRRLPTSVELGDGRDDYVARKPSTQVAGTLGADRPGQVPAYG